MYFLAAMYDDGKTVPRTFETVGARNAVTHCVLKAAEWFFRIVCKNKISLYPATCDKVSLIWTCVNCLIVKVLYASNNYFVTACYFIFHLHNSL